MPARIRARGFRPTYQQPLERRPKGRPKTKLDPGDVFGTKSGSRYHDAVMSDRQEGLATGLKSRL